MKASLKFFCALLLATVLIAPPRASEAQVDTGDDAVAGNQWIIAVTDPRSGRRKGWCVQAVAAFGTL